MTLEGTADFVGAVFAGVGAGYPTSFERLVAAGDVDFDSAEFDGRVSFKNVLGRAALSTNDPSAAQTCQLDGGGFKSCSSPATYSGLSYGRHVFDVEAADPAGNTATASYSWTIDYPG